MAKRKQTTRTPSERSAPSRRERRQAQRDASKHREELVLPSAQRFTRQDILPILALGVPIVVCYLPAMLWGGFVWDDYVCVTVASVRDVSGLWQIWFSPSALEGESHYWPLVYTTFWLEHKLWGFDPTGYHIVNVLLHLANTLLVWHLLRRLAVPGAWMVAAVFAVHPLHVESVAWIIERKDVLSGLFYLAAALAWMRFVEQPSSRRYACSLVLYAAAMLSKSIAITLPVALLILHWWKRGRVTSTDLLRLVPFFVVGLVITVGDLSFYWSETATSFDYSFTERALIAARALWFYAGKLLWPADLAVIYLLWDIRVADPLAWGYLIAAVALVVALWHFRRQLGRGPLAGALFFAVTLSPTLGFVDYTYMQYAFVADRFQYLAGIGVMVVVIGSAAHGMRRLSSTWQKGALGIAAVALVVLGMLTWRQASIYRDDETFHRHIIALNPLARNVHRHLGLILYERGQYEEALEPSRIAVAQRPNSAKGHSNLGRVLYMLGRFEEAETHLRRAIALNPQDVDTFRKLAECIHATGRYEEAIEVLAQAAALDPDSEQAAELHVLMEWAAQDNGQPEAAAEYYIRVLEIDPYYVEALHRLAELRIEQQRYDEALELFQRLIHIDPSSAVAYGNMGIVLFYLGRSDEALQHFDQALSLDPTIENVRANREAVLKAMEATQD